MGLKNTPAPWRPTYGKALPSGVYTTIEALDGREIARMVAVGSEEAKDRYDPNTTNDNAKVLAAAPQAVALLEEVLETVAYRLPYPLYQKVQKFIDGLADQ